MMMIIMVIEVLAPAPPHVSRYGFTLPDNDDYPDCDDDDDFDYK